MNIVFWLLSFYNILIVFFHYHFIPLYPYSLIHSLWILDINSLSDVILGNTLCNSLNCPFILLMISWAVQKLSSLMQSYFFLFPTGIYPKKYCYLKCPRFYCLFSSSIFMVSSRTCKPLIHLEFILVWCKKVAHFFVHICPSFPTPFNRLSLPQCIFLPPLSNTNWP